ncbi:hypothetical protein [Halobacillus sp. A5]|uniref:hypothetical protein n=1 Tax=Halobacillus sp. A5 TaxID=2880263 RepID=UPI0020A6B30B|nr:hypothetical protein [Halobacillus sp. A5]MCP3027720.1 hypothetical protein [Halobacillus sp. A5]
MWLIIVLGFIFPWVFGIYLYKKAPKIFYTNAPITALIAVVCNQLGIHFGLWKVHHMPKVVLLDSIFLDLGIFTIVGAWFTYLLHYKQVKPFRLLSFFIIGMTSLEYIMLVTEQLSYHSSWNIFYTFLMYIGGFTTLYFITEKLVKLKVYP